MILNSEENSMLTRREILVQLRRVGIDRLSMLKHDCREYKDYLAFNYDYAVARKKKDQSGDRQSIGKGKG